MAGEEHGPFTRLLQQETPDYSRLLPMVYSELRAIAQSKLRSERPDHTLSATALVHEAYIKLTGGADIAWSDRAHFFHASATAMRRILIDHARTRSRVKRGGRREEASWTPRNLIEVVQSDSPDVLLILDEAVCRLEEKDPGLASVVRLRFFGGLSVEHTAAALSLSTATVKRRWAFARIWLIQEVRAHPQFEESADALGGIVRDQK